MRYESGFALGAALFPIKEGSMGGRAPSDATIRGSAGSCARRRATSRPNPVTSFEAACRSLGLGQRRQCGAPPVPGKPASRSAHAAGNGHANGFARIRSGKPLTRRGWIRSRGPHAGPADAGPVGPRPTGQAMANRKVTILDSSPREARSAKGSEAPSAAARGSVKRMFRPSTASLRLGS